MRGRQGINLRRDGALKQLKEQLASGQKPEKINGKTTNNMIPHTDRDKKRINGEIAILEKKPQKGGSIAG
jgi:hypothetical protein